MNIGGVLSPQASQSDNAKSYFVHCSLPRVVSFILAYLCITSVAILAHSQ
jgi:hypothetical protein